MAVKTVPLEKGAMRTSEEHSTDNSLEQDANFMSKLVTFNYNLVKFSVHQSHPTIVPLLFGLCG